MPEMKWYLKISILILFCMKMQKRIDAQQPQTMLETQFELFNNKNGLSQGFVSCIFQDKTGFLWFATKDGLNKFDGYHITVYRYNPEEKYSLTDNSISFLTEDVNGNFWVGTRNKGLFLFDRFHENFYPIQRDASDNLVNNPITSIICHQQKMLVADYQDICVYDISDIQSASKYQVIPQRIKKIFSFNKLQHPGQPKSDNRLLPKVTWLQDNSIWKASSDSVFICSTNSSFSDWKIDRKSMSEFGMGPQRTFNIFPGLSQHQIIIVGSASLNVYDLKTHQVVFKQIMNDKSEPLIDYFLKEPFQVQDGKIMYYDKDGFHVFDPGTFKTQLYLSNEQNSKVGFYGVTHFVDNDGMLWIGSGGYGIYKYNYRTEHFNKFPFDASGFIEDEHKNMYFNFRKGAAILDIKNKTLLPVIPSSLWNTDWENPLVYCRSKNGSLWLQVSSKKSGQYMFLKYNTVTHTLEDHSDILYKDPNGQLLSVFTDVQNNLWQFYYDTDRSRKFIVADANTSSIKARYTLPLPKDVNKVSSFLNSTLQDAKGNFWFCTNLGLFQFNSRNTDPSKQWHFYKNNPSDTASLSSDIIFSVCPDPFQPEQYLWVGTNGRGFNRMNLQNGKCDRFDEKDGLPNNVVYGILNDDIGNLWLSTNQGLSCFNIRQKRFRNYTTEDGLMGNEFNRGQFYKATSGQLFFGGVDGITWFNPADILKTKNTESPIVITGFSVTNRTLDFKKDPEILPGPIQFTKSIILPYENNMFSIEFALLQFSSSEKKHYKYRLEGFDKDWINNDIKNTATFTNLDPGKYVFHVVGCNSDGIWNKEGASIQIIIQTPWYKTWWFRAIMLIAFFGSLYAFYRYRLKQSLKVISMRNLIASDLHDEIGSTISSITVYSEIIESRTNDPELKQIAERINNSSRNILVAMSDIVWSINPKNDRFDNVILRMKSIANEMTEAQEQTLHFEADSSLNELKMQMNDRKNFYLIFKEALNNSLKYAHAKHLYIRIQLQGDEILFSLKDDGIGFDTTESKEGNGLTNMQNRARDINGTLHINSTIHEGTEIELRFPLK